MAERKAMRLEIMEASEVAFLVATKRNSPFYYRKHMCVVPNVSYGMNLDYEADILAITTAGCVLECEIKVTVSDFKADMKKRKWILPPRYHKFYYAVPDYIYGRVANIRRPDGTGIITVSDNHVEVPLLATHHSRTSKMEAADVLQLARLGAMRLWSLETMIKFFPSKEVL